MAVRGCTNAPGVMEIDERDRLRVARTRDTYAGHYGLPSGSGWDGGI